MTALFVLDFVSIAAGQLWFVFFVLFFSQGCLLLIIFKHCCILQQAASRKWMMLVGVFFECVFDWNCCACGMGRGKKGKERWWQGFSAPNKVKLFQSSFCSPGFAGSLLSLITSHSRPFADIIWSVYADDFSVVVFSLCCLLRSLSLSHFFRSTSPNGVYTRSCDRLDSSFLPSVCFFSFAVS